MLKLKHTIVKMKISAHLEIVNNLAVKTGYKTASKSCYSELSLAKDQASNKYFLIVSNTKKTAPDKFKVIIILFYCTPL